MTGRPLIFVSAIVFTCTFAHAAAAQGALTQSWKTTGGWLTELRVHPNGAKVCSTGKAGYTPHAFGLTFVRSGRETVVVLVDQTEPPSTTGTGEMTFRQAGETIATVTVQTQGPAWATTDPTGPQAASVISKLTDKPLTIDVAGRRYEAELTGLADAMAQLKRCEAGETG